VRSLVVADLLVGALSALAALQLRFGASAPDQRNHLLATFAFPFAWLVVLALNRAYDVRFLFVGNEEYQRVFRASLGLSAAIAGVTFAFDTRLARGYVILAIPIALTAGIACRYAMRKGLHHSWRRGERLRRVILVGHSAAVQQTTLQLHRERFHGMGVVGVCLPTLDSVTPGSVFESLVFGTFDTVASAVKLTHADTVIVLSCPEIDGPALRRLAWQLEDDDVDLVVASNLIDVTGDRTTIRPLDGLPLMQVDHPRLSGTPRVLKAIFDRLCAAVGLLVAAPLMVVVAGLIRFGEPSRGPVVFRQVRIGKNGRRFVMYKFRTMYTDAEVRLTELRHLNDNDGALFKIRDDPRVTPVGRWLRRTSLDELPQLVNVLRGEMSLVGPRPPLPNEVARYPADMRRRLVVKPGITGLWQVSGRSDLSWEESIRLDLNYVENWSLSLDIVILTRTVTAVWRLSGAY
jgi:exopolysaccharide biosynthesis polyprenyl glycosylphosphotransferase